jgi:hypothetical protein
MQYKIIPSSLSQPSGAATASQCQALRELATKVLPIDRVGVTASLGSLTYEQASRRVGNSYLLATGQAIETTHTYLVPDDQAKHDLPKGSLVLLRCVDAHSLRKGDLAMCTDKREQYTLLGRVRRVQRGQFPPDLRLTLAQAEVEHTLWARRPNVFWFRVEVISLAC